MSISSAPSPPAATVADSANVPYYGVFDLFKIGIGPSSSHSVGPMRAAETFLRELHAAGSFERVGRVQVDLYGSLALTGRGHGTDVAVLMGLEGETPDQVETEAIPSRLAAIRESNMLALAGRKPIEFVEKRDLLFHDDVFLDAHPNALRFQAFDSEASAEPLLAATYYSIGGGFVVREGAATEATSPNAPRVPFPFTSARELLQHAEGRGVSFSRIARENERAFRSDAELSAGLQKIWSVMAACIERGCRSEGVLPGGLHVERRAPAFLQALTERAASGTKDPLLVLDWVDLFAMAVNEENAAGGRVVTAPTNGAAGIVPAVLMYFVRFCPEANETAIENFLLTAALIGSLYKRNASISGAEVGCQGEVGVACSMAAGALTEVLGGTPRQVEQAAEIGMEHNLGLTCDPIGGLVQIPCIERNAMGAVKAINASRLALRGDGRHHISLDRVIRVMKRTGADMKSQYKETSQGGLAVNVSEC
ncbi:MAG TPA: L-serine ammonia-lyase [Pirellulales bacterium]